MAAFYVAIALVSGVGLALQVGMSHSLRARVGNPIVAALISFVIGLVLLIGAVALLRPALPETADLRRAPWWIWMGGALGALYVGCSAAFARHLGAAGWLGLVVTGQVLASLVLDHYGLVGFARHPVSAVRLVGAVLLVTGVALVLKS